MSREAEVVTIMMSLFNDEQIRNCKQNNDFKNDCHGFFQKKVNCTPIYTTNNLYNRQIK